MSKAQYKVLVVDDEQSFSLLLSRILEDEGYRVKTAGQPQEALALLDRYDPDLIISDLKMPGMSGIEFMSAVKQSNPDVAFVMITAHATVETAVAAMKMGALDYITKPLKEPEELRRLVLNAYEKSRLVAENMTLREELQGDLPPLPIIFAGVEATLDEIRAVAPTDATVMLYGETGTGKSIIAQVIHSLSKRKGLLVTINCSAIPENLLESELFGHERGAFTGALRTKRGKFELAGEGTVFLDEVAEMSASLQPKLLRVLQERSFERLGGIETIRTDCRVIAATNRDLKAMVSDQRFREDLFYRLNVFPLHVPALRERRPVIPLIAEYLMKKLALKSGKTFTGIAQKSMERLITYPWPGNIRELENAIERSVILSRTTELTVALPESPGEDVLGGDMKSIEKKAIEHALKTTGGNRREAAEVLGISLRSLQYKIKEYAIDR